MRREEREGRGEKVGERRKERKEETVDVEKLAVKTKSK